MLDPALTRPGRLSRRVEVPLPDEAARAAILGVHLRATPLQPGSDRRALCAVLGRLTGGLSGAELANVVNEAALLAGRRGAEVCRRPRRTCMPCPVPSSGCAGRGLLAGAVEGAQSRGCTGKLLRARAQVVSMRELGEAVQRTRYGINGAAPLLPGRGLRRRLGDWLLDALAPRRVPARTLGNA